MTPFRFRVSCCQQPQPAVLLEAKCKIPGVYRAQDTHVSPLRLFCAISQDNPRETEPGCGEELVLDPIAVLNREWLTMFCFKTPRPLEQLRIPLFPRADSA